ncbi:hypothetical protein SAMN04487906_1309 [Zhouia amylolytica]|uniref:Uncharacterized protein n=1 Tax=Zhouia amylolytica TaxID=376730 RepID=A0A1I6RTA6_9FLAO|nr:hypothetical protein [Zhouia amylolytica]SFS67941.1 hypothetical protein SAMN04487906_1309 [Zhouia amylolytica]
MKKIKLIWDFRGPAAKKTAEHHLIHLQEYLALENIPFIVTDIESLSEFHTIAYIAVEEIYMKKIRDELKPHRGQLYTL